MQNTKQVTLYDTTLRDGAQGEGISFSSLDKMRIAEKLDSFGMDYIEGGWPGSNPKDIEFFQEAKKRTWRHAKISAFGSTRRANVRVEDDAQITTLLEAETPVVCLYGKSWRLHVTEVLRTTAEENCAMIRDSVRFFQERNREVFYDAEHFFDGYKDDAEHAIGTLLAAEEGGAAVLVLCDTNGGTLPHEVEAIVTEVKQRLRTPIGIHTHDDSGLGVANALAAVRAGACQVQGTTNGYGERTGNCNITTIIPILQLKMGLTVVDDLARLTEVSRFVEETANLVPNIRAPFVGSTAFSHKGGTHVNAVQKLARTYEHVQPELVGNTRTILISELSGQSNVLMKAEDLGIKLDKADPRVRGILSRLKERENEGYEYEAADASFELLIRKELGLYQPLFELKEYHVTHRYHALTSAETCEATVKLAVNGQQVYEVEEGDGPINALDLALRKALRHFYPEVDDVALTDYKVRIMGSHAGTAAGTRVLVTSRNGEGTPAWGTVGVSYNIIDASWEAIVDSLEYHIFQARK